MRKGGLLVALLLVVQLPGLSQASLSDWQNLSKIPAGTIVDVDKVVFTTTGKFVGFSDKDVTLIAYGRRITIPKADVIVVSVKRGVRTLTGTAAGAAAGAALGAAAGETAGDAGPSAVVGGALGAAIAGGLTWGDVIYKAELRRKKTPAPGAKQPNKP